MITGIIGFGMMQNDFDKIVNHAHCLEFGGSHRK